MDADKRIIPVVGDDQGEGIKDPWEELLADDDSKKAYQNAQKEQQKAMSRFWREQERLKRKEKP